MTGTSAPSMTANERGIPGHHWLTNECRQQAANLATLFRGKTLTPDIIAPPTDTLLGRYADTNTQWERWLHRYIDAFADPDAIALDIGANIGFHTGHLAATFAAVHAFEPCSDTFAYLGYNTLNLRNVTLHNCALGSAAGSALMSVKSRNRGASHISATGTERIDVYTLDDFDFGARVGLLKVDVEGFEPDVFLGGERLLRQDRPAILFEDMSRRASKVLQAMGYSVRRIAAVDYLAIPR